MAMVVLAVEVGLAPAWIAAAISCMRALPAGCARIQRTENTPYSIATTPAAMASHSALSSVIKASPF
jgi:hypothetical protein